MFYNKVYKGKNANKPHLEDPDEFYYVTDPDLRKIILASVEDTPWNNEMCFFMDSVAQSYAYIIAYTIIGIGVRVSVRGDDEEAEKKIADFNGNINVHYDTIDDYIIDTIIDNFIHGYSLWRVAPVDGVVDIQRISPKTIEIKYDNYEGWRKFVQSQAGVSHHKSKNAFLRDDPLAFKVEAATVNIPDEPDKVIYSSFFRRPPMSSVNHLISYKRWILMFMRKFAEKMWAPTRIGYVGDPKTNFMPTNDLKLAADIDNLTTALSTLRNFSTIAIPGNFRVETDHPTNSGEVYLKYIDMLNEEIMFGLFGSMGIRNSSQSWRSNSVVDESLIHVMRGIRERLEKVLSRFYVSKIVPHVDPKDIIFHWSPLRTSNIGDTTDAVERLSKLGIFKSPAEIRRAASIVFPFLSEERMTPEEEKYAKDFMIMMNAPGAGEKNVSGMDNTKKTTKDAGSNKKPSK